MKLLPMGQDVRDDGDADRTAGVARGVDQSGSLVGLGRIDAVLDLVSDAAGFAALASLVRSGGSAVTTRYVADEQALRATGVTGVNFALPMSTELLQRVAEAVADGRIVAPPITRISLEDAVAALSPAQERPARGKTVITL